MWIFHNPGLLGINARNLLYIKAYNPKKAIVLADSKIKTKNYLSARGIPVARLYASISGKTALEKFDWNSLPATFAIKPNAGYGGEGILIIKGKKGVNWVRESGEIMPHEDLIRHVNDILDGRYSLADLSDIALIEQRLEAPDPFNKMSYKGLPDIRVVVHNLIPVMAMLRLSTEQSAGKANVHMGGISCGIDIAKGEISHISQFHKPIDSIPGFGDLIGFKIPFWGEILLIASRVQQITNLGFAAVDIAIDKNTGPVLLEINARAGLEVQVANMAPLRRRLERIQGIKVNTPEKGVRIAQDIFGQKIEVKEKSEIDKKIVGHMERVEVIGKSNQKIVAKIDPNIEKSILDEAVAKKIGLTKDAKLKFTLMDTRIQTIVELSDLFKNDYKMILGNRDLRDFLIDPSKHMTTAENSEVATSDIPCILRTFSEADLIKIDQELADIDSEIKLLNHLKPINLKEEHTKFLVDPTYSPQFEYCDLKFSPNNLHARLKRLEFPDTAMGTLWRKKSDEIHRKIELLESRGTDHFTSQSMYLYDAPEEKLLKEAISVAKTMPKKFPEPAKELTSKEAKKVFEQAIEEYGLKGWSVKIKEDMVSDAIAGKENSVMLRADATFSVERLKGTIAHEIETHVFRAMNGALQPYKIFQRGLADYLLTEEGLAVYNQEQTEAVETTKKYWPASSVIGIATAIKGSFADVYAEVLKYGFSADRAWKVALKAKRGTTDTGKPGAFTKDFVYFKGHREILDFVQKGGDLSDLYFGKITIKDIDIVKKVKGIKAPIYLPSHLHKRG